MLESKKPILPTKKDRQERVRDRVRELDKKLDLSEEQEKKIYDIMWKAKEEVNKILEESGEKIAALKMEMEERWQEILTQEQRDRLKGLDETEEDDESLAVIKSAY